MEILDSNGLTEQQYIELYKTKSYDRPYLTADVVVIDKDNRVLLIKRKGHPFLGKYAIPGGFANPDENIMGTALRELEEETGVTGIEIIPVGLYSEPGRDPRGWVVSQAFVAKISEDLKVTAGDDAAEAIWFEIVRECGKIFLVNNTLRISADELAFDHAQVLADALDKVSL